MALKILLASLVGALVLMVWGLVFWTVLPVGQNMLGVIEAEDAVIDVLDRNIGATGVYFVPLAGMDDESGQQAFLEKHKRGPLARITFRKEGVDAQSPMVFVKGFLHFFVSVLLLVGIMGKALFRLVTYWSRVTFTLLLGIFAAFFSHLGDPIWFHAPLKYAIYFMDYHIIGWILVGLAISPIIKPQT